MNDDALLEIAREYDALNSDAALEIAKNLRRLDSLRQNAAAARMRARVAKLRREYGGKITAALLGIQNAVRAAEREVAELGEEITRLAESEQRLRLEAHPGATRLRAETDLEASRLASLDREIKKLTADRTQAIRLLEGSGLSLDSAAEVAKPGQNQIDALVEQRQEVAKRHQAMLAAGRSMASQVEYLRAAA